MSAASDNALAASGMRSALGDIGNFLYRNQVEKPYVQAQTKNLGLQGEALQASTKGQNIQNQLEQFKSDVMRGANQPVFPDLADSGADAAATADRGNPDASTGGDGQPQTDGGTVPDKTPAAMTSPAQSNTALAAALPPVIPQLKVPYGGSEGGNSVPNVKASRPMTQSDYVMPAAAKPPVDNSPFRLLSTSQSIAKPGASPGNTTQPATMGDMPSPAPKVSAPTSSSGSMNAGSTAGGTEQSPVQPPTNAPRSAPTSSVAYYNELSDDQKAQARSAIETSRAARGIPGGVDEGDVAQAWNEHAQKLIPPFTPGALQRLGLGLTGFGPQGPTWGRLYGGGQNGGGLPWEQFKDIAASTIQAGNADPAVHDAFNIGTAADEVMRQAQAASDPKATNPGINDKTMLIAFAKTIDPTIRAGQEFDAIKSNPVTQEFGKVLEEVWKGGGSLTPQMRATVVQAAMANRDSAVSQANSAIGWHNSTATSAYGLPPIVPPLPITAPGSAAPAASSLPRLTRAQMGKSPTRVWAVHRA